MLVRLPDVIVRKLVLVTVLVLVVFPLPEEDREEEAVLDVFGRDPVPVPVLRAVGAAVFD